LSPERAREIRRTNWAKYVAKNGEVLNARRRERHDPTKAKLTREKYKAANPDRVKILARKGRGLRRARLRAATIGDLTDIHKIYERCHWWKQWFDVVVDHVISLARGGTHEAKNLQIIYRFENEKKGSRLDYKPRVIFT
jgi:5-methylcytosine-specific restriction endonuclease McrA